MARHDVDSVDLGRPACEPDGDMPRRDRPLEILAAQVDAEREGRTQAERIATQRERLLELTGELSRASRLDDVADAIATQVRAASGARTAAFWTVVEGGAFATLVRASGDEGLLLRGYRTFPVEDWLALGSALLTGEPVWLESRREFAARFPRSEALSAEQLGSREVAFACLPLIVDGRPMGALSITFGEAHVFAEHERQFIVLLARHCAQAFDRARIEAALRESEAQLRRLLAAEKRARIRIGRMQEVTAALSRARTAEDVAEVACRIGSEAMEAHSGALWMAAADGLLHLAGSWGAPDGLTQQYRVLPAGARSAPAIEVLRTGEPLWIETEDDHRRAAPDIHEEAKAAGKLSSYGAAPVFLDARAAGVLCFAHPSGHLYDADDRAFHVALATHCSQALDRAKLYNAAREAAQRAEEANRIKDEFLATVSHELRTPLNAITGWVSVLQRKASDPAAVAKGVEVIRRNAQAQAKIIEDILDVSRIITGKLRIDPRPVDLVTIARDALDVVRPSAEAKEIALALVTSRPSFPFVGDPERLQQVVWNLLSNAVKFTRRGGRITATIEQEGSSVVFAVADSGKGIAPELLPHVFERFQQGDSSTARRFGGLGLGLAIVRHIVELHGGRAVAESDGDGKGATFRVVLPVRAVAPPSRPPEERPSAVPPEPRPAAGDIRGLRVLVVDDEPDARDVLGEVFAAEGCIVDTAASSREGLESLSRFRPDIIISDIGMPLEDGYAFIAKVRARPGIDGGATPAIALTAYARTEDRQRALEAGFNLHVPKPVDARELVAAVAGLRAAGKA